jgi:hypothetical protein
VSWENDSRCRFSPRRVTVQVQDVIGTLQIPVGAVSFNPMGMTLLRSV